MIFTTVSMPFLWQQPLITDILHSEEIWTLASKRKNVHVSWAPPCRSLTEQITPHPTVSFLIVGSQLHDCNVASLQMTRWRHKLSGRAMIPDKDFLLLRGSSCHWQAPSCSPLFPSSSLQVSQRSSPPLIH